TLLDFTISPLNATALMSTVIAPDLPTVVELVDWFLSKRFGLLVKQVMGAIENSTGALLTRPFPPYWYPLAPTPPSERALFDAFMSANASRPNLLFVGSKDGALHAFRTNPLNTIDPLNGQEAWAFIPFDVAQRLLGDKTSGQITAYPDGSPTLVNAKI